MKNWIKSRIIFMLIICILILYNSICAQERYEKVNIYMQHGYISAFIEDCSFNEDYTRVNHSAFFSTVEPNFINKLQEKIRSIEKVKYEGYENNFLSYVVIDFIQNSSISFSISLDDDGNFRIRENEENVYMKQRALVEFLYEHFGFVLNPYRSLNEENNDK